MDGLSMHSHGEPKKMFITVLRHPWIKTTPIHVSTYPKAQGFRLNPSHRKTQA